MSTTRQDIIGAIDETERRLRSLADQIRANPDTRLLEGEWSVRDALCHLAARANDVAILQQLAQLSGGGLPTEMETAEINNKQIADRTQQDVDALIDEASRGYAEARAAANQLTDDQLTQPAPPIPGLEPMSIGELLVLTFRGHAQAHIATIEQAFASK